MTLDLHDILQWGALATLIGTVWWRLRQRDDRLATEIRRQTDVEHRLGAIEGRFEAHKNDDAAVIARLDRMSEDIHSVDKRLARIETILEGTAK